MRLALVGILSNNKYRLIDVEKQLKGFIDVSANDISRALTDGGVIIGIDYVKDNEVHTKYKGDRYPIIDATTGRMSNEIVALYNDCGKISISNGLGKIETMSEDMLIEYASQIGVANCLIDGEHVTEIDGVKTIKTADKSSVDNMISKMLLSGASRGLDVDDKGVVRASDCVEQFKQVILTNGMTGIANYGFSDREISKVKLSSTIKVIGAKAFSNVTGLDSIELNYGLERIEDSAFVNSSIEKIDIPSTVNFIGASAFRGCKQLKQVKLSSSIQSIETCMFESCRSLTDIVVPYSVKEIKGAAFYGCYSLKHVTLLGGRQRIDRGAIPRKVTINIIR